ncbi:tetratricopeptide repeat protein [Thalassotalea agarivorans]|uniref:TPR repeat n=1 Tax=Thalassotalea agarivorans TaxID=349064 RepID=A0A1H9ZH13_THASX|nr:tetratricopeptide repeat protein [Thalassotalea agarivorans]SES80786.1 TPR repeat [Thalassotalea agarivorans]
MENKTFLALSFIASLAFSHVAYADSMFSDEVTQRVNKDMQKRLGCYSFKQCKALAEDGSVRHQSFMSEVYLMGEAYGIKSDEGMSRKKVFFWMKVAAENGALSEQSSLARAYLYGSYENEVDLEKATYWANKVIAAESKSGYFVLGEVAKLEKRYKDAMKNYRLADGATEAEYQIAELYFHGHGVERDIEKAKGHYKNANRLGDSEASYKLGIIARYHDKDDKKALYYFESATHRGRIALGIGEYHPQSKEQIALMRLDKLKPGDNYEYVAELFLSGARNKLPVSTRIYGQLLWGGKGVDKNQEMAVKFFNVAASMKDGRAAYLLSDAYRNGLVVEKDEKKANEFLRYAASLKDIASVSLLGRYYLAGQGGFEQNYDKAFEALMYAGHKGDAEALYALGFIYEYGAGRDIDKASAKKYYNYAAQRGDQRAKAKLEKM